MPWSLQAAKRLSRSKNVFCTVEFCTAECNQSNPLSDEIRSTKLALSKELQKSPQTRHIERHTPHVSSHSMSKLLETHPPPKRTLFNGVCPFVFTAHTLHLKTSVSACRSKPFRIHPPACQNPWSHNQPQKHPFQWVYLLRIKRSIEHRHMGPLRSERFKCFGNKPTHICPQIHACSNSTPTNTLPSKPRPPKKDTCDQPSQTICCIDTSHHALISHSKTYSAPPSSASPSAINSTSLSDEAHSTSKLTLSPDRHIELYNPPNLDIERHTQHVSSHSPPCHNPTPTERTRGGSIPTVTHVPHGT